MDDYGPGTDPIRMAVDITFDGKGEVEVDFSRSSDTVPARQVDEVPTSRICCKATKPYSTYAPTVPLITPSTKPATEN